MACKGCSTIYERNESLYGCHNKAAGTAANGGKPLPYCMECLAILARRGFSIEPWLEGESMTTPRGGTG